MVQNKPESKWRAGQVTASVWSNQREINGEKVDVKNVQVERNYKDGEEWKKTNSYPVEQIPKLIVLLQKVYQSMTVKREP